MREHRERIFPDWAWGVIVTLGVLAMVALLLIAGLGRLGLFQ